MPSSSGMVLHAMGNTTGRPAESATESVAGQQRAAEPAIGGGGPFEPATGRGSAVEPLAWRGRAVRVAVTLLGAVLLLIGTVWGQDDDFPFGPFRMYATTDDLDKPVPDTRLEATDSSGATVLLTQDNTGIRRAEIEGQLSRFTAEPALLKVVVDAYAQRNPQAPAVREVRVVVRWHDVRDGLPTGSTHDEVAAAWTP